MIVAPNNHDGSLLITGETDFERRWLEMHYGNVNGAIEFRENHKDVIVRPLAIIKAECPHCGIVVKIKPDENGYYHGHCPWGGHEVTKQEELRLKILDKSYPIINDDGSTTESSAFTDTELQAFLDDAGGNLTGAAGRALKALCEDRERLITWSRVDMEVDYDRLQRDLMEISHRYLVQASSGGGS